MLIVIILIAIVLFLWWMNLKRNVVSPTSTDVDNAIRDDLAQQDVGAELADAVSTAMTGGKRVRALILLDMANNVSGGNVDSMPCALAIEYLHAASLVVDDMPYFDNDSIRRGKPSVHAKHGIAAAHMAAASLSSLAMRALSRQTRLLIECSHPFTYIGTLKTGEHLSDIIASCFGDAADGQLRELNMKELDLFQIMSKKTASIFVAAARCGFEIGNASRVVKLTCIDQVSTAAYEFGMAYQLADDVSDRDTDNPGINAASIIGEIPTRRLIHRLLASSRRHLEMSNLWTDTWRDLFGLVTKHTDGEE